LLWSQNQRSVAFWSLGQTSDQAFRSVEVLNLEANIAQVFDVPGEQLAHRKLLQASDSRFFILDLESRESFPMLSNSALSLLVAPDGLRAWAYSPGSNSLAQVDLSNLEPTSMRVERDIQQVFDIQSGAESRALIALHAEGNWGATVMDAIQPDTAESRFFPGLLLGDIQ
jgi:hypothetical protein